MTTRKKAAPKPPVEAPPAEAVLRYVGDGSVFQSNVPNRDVTTDDNLSDELLELAVDTGTHERI